MKNQQGELRAQKSYFFVYYYLLAGIALLIAVFLFAKPTSALSDFSLEQRNIPIANSS